MRAQALALFGLATMVAAAFIGLGEDVGSMVMAVAGGALVVIGVVAAWAQDERSGDGEVG